MANYNEKIIKWSGEEGGNAFIGINAYIRYLSKNLFFDYEPTLGAHPEFDVRLNNWLNNVESEEDQKKLVKLIPHLFYVGREELNSLYKTAFESIICRWLFDQKINAIEKADYSIEMDEMIKSTWFCPVTDSFRINQFYHVNNVSATHEFRPDWRSLKKFGSDDKISTYIKNNNVKQIVLLEDFVGTGGQVFNPLKYCVETFDLKVLFVPLIICNPGCEKLKEITHQNFSFNPVIHIPKENLVNKRGFTNAPLVEYISLSENLFDAIMGTNDRSRMKTFGYEDTGCLTVMHSNTPNNSIPLIHVESNTWDALFKRHSRS
jgi:hypothetical protein